MHYQFFGLILLVLAVSAIIYVASNGDSLLQFKLPVLDGIHSISLSTSDFTQGVTWASGRLKENVPAPAPAIKEPEKSPSQLPVKESVKISDIRWPTNSRPLEVVLYSNLNKGETVNITGWTIKSNFGSFTIPQAQKIYSFGGVQGDIILGYRDSVHFYSGRGVKGNFLLNKCSGYLQDIAPSIPKQCPRPTRSEVENFNGYSQDYILSLKSCEQPSANPPIPYDDFACHDFLKTLNYVGCVEKYKNDQDFLLGEWWVWPDNQINIFDPVHDRAQLLDKEGNLVDEYNY